MPTCPECDFQGPDEEWIDTDTECETCGFHVAWKCPQCGEVYDDIFKVRIEE